MSTILLDTWQGSGSIHGHVPDQGGGNWVHQDLTTYPANTTIVAGGKGSLVSPDGLVYVDYFMPMPTGVDTFTAEFEFLSEPDSDSSGTEFGATLGLAEADNFVSLRVGGYYYSHPGNANYDPPKFNALVLGEEYTGQEVEVSRPVPGGTRVVKLMLSAASQTVTFDGEVVVSATEAVPADVQQLCLSFKLLGRHSLQKVTVTGGGERPFWTGFRRTAEVSEVTP